MQTVLIVEDNLMIQRDIEESIRKVKDVKIIKTGYAAKALEIANNSKVDLFLIDINLLDYSGFKLAEQIRCIEKYKMVFIIFITSIPTKELEAFKKIHCYDYIIKPFSQNDLINILRTILKYEFKEICNKKIIKFKQKSFTYEINEDDIICIEVQYKKLHVVTTKERLEFTSYTLSQIEDMLSDDFLRCHRSFIINKNYIEGIYRDRSMVKLKGLRECVPYGRKYRDELKGMWL